jgi:hypothetical protein
MPEHEDSTVAEEAAARSFDDRLGLARRIFRGALAFNAALTVLCLWALASGTKSPFIGATKYDAAAFGRILAGVLFFYVAWGLIWYGVKGTLLAYVAGFSRDERRDAFSSRMSKPYDVSAVVARHSERRIRIIDMIGRRGRFITIASAGFFYLYGRIAAERPETFATAFLQDNLFDAVITTWVLLALFYRDGFLPAVFFGPQSRIMDGVLARANCLLITMLWTAFKFVMLPIGAALATHFPPEQFVVVFALIWGAYIVTDTLAEVGGSIFGRQSIRVWGIGDVNRKSIGGTLTGFAGALVFSLALVVSHQLPAPWVGLAIAIAVANTLLELYSPRGTDDLVMATGNALLCWAFGAFVL